MYRFWCDCLKQKYSEQAKLFSIDADSFIVCTKTDNIYQESAEDLKTRFVNSNYELHRPLPKGKKIVELEATQLISNEIIYLKKK